VGSPASVDVPIDLVTLEGGRFARAVISGPCDDDYRFAYARQLEWLADGGLACRRYLRMRFGSDRRNTDDPSEYATELIWPVTDPRTTDMAAAERDDLTHRWLEP
jgi:effector-binding domain-containing protein